MIPYKAIQLGECWGVDTDGPLTPALLDALAQLDVATVCPHAPPGTRVTAIFRYVGLGGPTATDITQAELHLILQHPHKFRLVLVQHVEAGSWVADESVGLTHGQYAVHDAQEAGYQTDLDEDLVLSLIVDMESLRNPGPGALAYEQRWKEYVAGEGFGPAIYEGFDAGLTGQQLVAEAVPLWSDAGPRVLPDGATFACKQYAQVKVGGRFFDFDHLMVDDKGRSLVGLGMP
jgi:hypothetical protein